jgi:hypothetical protein
VKPERAKRAALVAQPFLAALPKRRRRELVREATDLIREHGAEGLVSDPDAPPVKLTRARRRDMARALGWRGTKAKRQNFDKRLPKVAQALAMDQALTAANARLQMGPIERARVRIAK